jgi:hypothetical protein
MFPEEDYRNIKKIKKIKKLEKIKEFNKIRSITRLIQQRKDFRAHAIEFREEELD